MKIEHIKTFDIVSNPGFTNAKLDTMILTKLLRISKIMKILNKI